MFALQRRLTVATRGDFESDWSTIIWQKITWCMARPQWFPERRTPCWNAFDDLTLRTNAQLFRKVQRCSSLLNWGHVLVQLLRHASLGDRRAGGAISDPASQEETSVHLQLLQFTARWHWSHRHDIDLWKQSRVGFRNIDSWCILK